MSHREPMRRFLGLDASADPIDVLGLEPTQLDMKSILKAREVREQEIQDHPDGGSEAAQEVRAHVRDAAVLLLDANAKLSVIARHIPVDIRNQGKPGSATVSSITNFDRQVLGILMACGGWNSRSRAQLMMIASQHGVSPRQLMDVLIGMTRWLRSGGPDSNLSLQGIATPGSTIQRALASTAAVPTSEAFDRFVDRWTPDIRATDSASVARLSILFASTAIFLLVLILGIVLSMPDTGVDQSNEWTSGETPSSLDSRASFPEVDSVGGLVMEDVVSGGEILVRNLDLPRSFHDASDAVVGTTVGLDLLAEGIARGESASITQESFAELIDVASRGWLLTGATQRAELIDTIKQLFVTLGDDRKLAKSLLLDLTVSTPGRFGIEQIPVNAFRAGILGVLADDRQVSPSIREEARSLLVSSDIQGLDGSGFAPAALAWLEQSKSVLLEESERSQDSELAWLAWIQSVIAVDDKARSQRSLVTAVDALVHRGLSISKPGPTRGSLVRILSALDYSDSNITRDTILALYVDPDLSSHRLWVLTNLLAQLAATPWFDKSIVAGASADANQRYILQAQLASRWPDSVRVTYDHRAPVPTGFNAGIAGYWLDQWDILQEHRSHRSDVAMLQHLLRMRLMNQSAAAMADGHTSKAIKLLRELEAEEASEDAIADSQEPPMSTNSWGHRMSKARTREEKIKTLDELLKHKAGDLRTYDASVLAHVALAASERIRTHGQMIIEQRFQDDPELMMALLDQVPVTPSRSVSDFMEAIIGHSLPDRKSSRWSWETKRFLAKRAMTLRATDAKEIDELTSKYIHSVLDEVGRLTNQSPKYDMLPENALALLAEARADRVRGVMSASDLSILTEAIKQHEARFRLAEDSIQMALVRLLAVLDMLSLEWAIKTPSRAEEIEMIKESTLLELPVASHTLDQLMIVEQAIGETWRLVLLTYRQQARAKKEPVG